MNANKLLTSIIATSLIIIFSNHELLATGISDSKLNISLNKKQQYTDSVLESDDDVSTDYSDSESNNSSSKDLNNNSHIKPVLQKQQNKNPEFANKLANIVANNQRGLKGIKTNDKTSNKNISNTTNEKETQLVKQLESILSKMINARTINEYNEYYNNICKLFYEVWSTKNNSKVTNDYNDIKNIWESDDVNYLKLQGLWESVYNKHIANIIQILDNLFKGKNIISTEKSNTKSSNKKPTVFNKLRQQKKLTNATNENNKYNIKKLNDIRYLIKDYINYHNKTTITQAISMSSQGDPIFYKSSEFSNDMEHANIDDYLNTIKIDDNSTNLNNKYQPSPEFNMYKDEQHNKQMFNEIAEKVNKSKLAKMNNVQNNNVLNSQVKSYINNNTNKKTTKQISENDLKNINKLLFDLSYANSIQEYEANYIKLCEIFYNIWQKYNTKQLDNLNNNSIWKQDDSVYTKLQREWENIRVNYLKNINDKLRGLYKNSNNMIRMVNKNIFKLNDVRTLIKNYIVFLKNQPSK